MVRSKEIIFLVHSLECGIGGMESHQKAFIKYFTGESKYSIGCSYIIENKDSYFKILKWDGICFCVVYTSANIENIMTYFKVKQTKGRNFIFVLNDSWWIEYIHSIRATFKENIIAIRVGGNDIELAPWNIGKLNYVERRFKWKLATNQANYVIANSNYTCYYCKIFIVYI